ncbi:MAG: hypothetical protein GY760_03415 [Deltaproteobacteria bacterium]|nr:hypothetical protein [Deltaproteobacteria bacterium]
MKKIMLIFTVLLFCWSCDVPGNMVDTELKEADFQSRNLYANDEDDEDDEPGDQDCDEDEEEGGGSSGGSYTRPSFPKPIPSNLPNVKIQLYKHNYFVEPLTVEDTTNMISGFRYLGSGESYDSNTGYKTTTWGLDNLCKYRFNDEMSSIKVFNNTGYPIDVVFYEHANYKGTRRTFHIYSENPLEFESLKRYSLDMWTSWNDDVTSIKINVKKPFIYIGS